MYIPRFQELRRDLQTVISTRTNFNIMHIDDFGGETFLSENVTNNILQEFNLAIDRCCTVLIFECIINNSFSSNVFFIVYKH